MGYSAGACDMRLSDDRGHCGNRNLLAKPFHRKIRTLIVGVSDDGEPVGVEADKFPDEDKMNLHLVNIIKERIGPSSMLYISPRFDDYQDARVLVLECLPAKTPVFVKDGNIERFFVRTGAATSELSASQTQEFIKSRFAA
jgi:predicted HTH transcriptional regulator